MKNSRCVRLTSEHGAGCRATGRYVCGGGASAGADGDGAVITGPLRSDDPHLDRPDGRAWTLSILPAALTEEEVERERERE